jgi:hypothetical protein
VYDAKSKVALWSATEQPKMGLKQKAREDKLVEAGAEIAGEVQGESGTGKAVVRS